MKYRVVIGGLNDQKTANLIASRQHHGPGVTVVVEQETCPHEEYAGTGHCAEMSCPNYVNKHRRLPLRPHNHRIDGEHWQDCPGCDDGTPQRVIDDRGQVRGTVETEAIREHFARRTLAQRGAMGHHGSDDYRSCDDPKHWDYVPQEVG